MREAMSPTEIQNNLEQMRKTAGLKEILRVPVLSMGMSGDYEVAMEEGATIIRVGSSIFGGRT